MDIFLVVAMASMFSAGYFYGRYSERRRWLRAITPKFQPKQADW
jgi:hypothetical protein